MKTISVIIPAYNEGQAIGKVIRELLDSFSEWEEELVPQIVVVDDGSSDDTAQIVSAYPEVKLIRHRGNKGYGAALKTGMREAEGDILAWYDADGQHRPEDLKKVIARMINENLDYCIGIRGRNSYEERSRRLGKKVLKSILCFIVKEDLRDFNSGMRAFKREVILPYLMVLPNTFGASTVTTILMMEQEYKGGETDITVRRREGKSSVRQVRDGLRTIRLIFQIILLFQPMRFFGKSGVLMIVLGALYGFMRAVQWGNGIPISASILIIFGFQLLCFGALSNQLSKILKQGYEMRNTYPG